MSSPIEILSGHRRGVGRRLPSSIMASMLTLALAWGLAVAEPAAAQSDSGTTASETTSESTSENTSENPSQLRERIEGLYSVSPTPDGDGLVLEPRTSRFGVRRIEIVGTTVAVNGARVPSNVLRSWLGEEAEWILAVADLGTAQRRRLFGFATAAEAVDEPPAEELPFGDSAAAPNAVAVESAVADSVEVPADDSAREIETRRSPQPPQPPRPDSHYRRGDEVTVLRNLVIPAGESVREAVSVMGSVMVEGEVRGDVTAVMGSVTVDGLVEGSVVAVGGSVIVNEGGEITRDATSIGGSVERHGGGEIRGSVVEVPFLGGNWSRTRGSHWGVDRGVGRWRHSWWNGLWEFFWFGVWLALCALVISIVVLIAPRFVASTADLIRADWWKAGLVGLLAAIVFFPALVVLLLVLAVTIIGIPLVVLTIVVTPFLVFGIWLLGIVAVARRVGQWILAQLGRGSDSDYAPVLLGLLALASFHMVSSLFELIAVGVRWFGLPAALFSGLGDLVWIVAGVVGVGAVLLTLIDRRRRRVDEALYPGGSYAERKSYHPGSGPEAPDGGGLDSSQPSWSDQADSWEADKKLEKPEGDPEGDPKDDPEEG